MEWEFKVKYQSIWKEIIWSMEDLFNEYLPDLNVDEKWVYLTGTDKFFCGLYESKDYYTVSH